MTCNVLESWVTYLPNNVYCPLGVKVVQWGKMPHQTDSKTSLTWSFDVWGQEKVVTKNKQKTGLFSQVWGISHFRERTAAQ